MNSFVALGWPPVMAPTEAPSTLGAPPAALELVPDDALIVQGGRSAFVFGAVEPGAALEPIVIEPSVEVRSVFVPCVQR